MIQMLFVGVDGDGNRTFNPKMSDSIHRVVAASTTATNQQSRVWDAERRQLLIEQSRRSLNIDIAPNLVNESAVVGFSRRTASPIHGRHPLTTYSLILATSRV
jgi:hypothetical protein